MEESCCKGSHLNQSYYDKDKKITKYNVDDLSLVNVELLKTRLSIPEVSLKEVCKKHRNKYLRDYPINFQKYEDPFKGTKVWSKRIFMKSH